MDCSYLLLAKDSELSVGNREVQTVFKQRHWVVWSPSGSQEEEYDHGPWRPCVVFNWISVAGVKDVRHTFFPASIARFNVLSEMAGSSVGVSWRSTWCSGPMLVGSSWESYGSPLFWLFRSPFSRVPGQCFVYRKQQESNPMLLNHPDWGDAWWPG